MALVQFLGYVRPSIPESLINHTDQLQSNPYKKYITKLLINWQKIIVFFIRCMCVWGRELVIVRENRDNIITLFKSFEIATLNSALVVKFFSQKVEIKYILTQVI